MKGGFPKKASLGWTSEIRNKHFGLVLLELFIYYLFINLMFSFVHYYFSTLSNAVNLFDYVYFSFVTSLSIGYGDIVPITIVGKVLSIVQTCTTAMYFALMVSVLSIKLFYPKDLIRFSTKIIYNPKLDVFIFRVININKEALVNPNLRISVTEHNTGNKSVGVFNVPIEHNVTYLGKYDFSYSFKSSYNTFNVINEVNKANEFNNNLDESSFQSRFRINISLTGSYGFNEIAIYKKYFAKDVVIGESFKLITYTKEFYGKKGIVRYKKIKNFWEDFDCWENFDCIE